MHVPYGAVHVTGRLLGIVEDDDNLDDDWAFQGLMSKFDTKSYPRENVKMNMSYSVISIEQFHTAHMVKMYQDVPF